MFLREMVERVYKNEKESCKKKRQNLKKNLLKMEKFQLRIKNVKRVHNLVREMIVHADLQTAGVAFGTEHSLQLPSALPSIDAFHHEVGVSCVS